MSKHTPGPWYRDGQRSDSMGSAIIRGANGFEVANSRSWIVSEYEANANLIAASPEMYELLKTINTVGRLSLENGIPVMARVIELSEEICQRIDASAHVCETGVNDE